MATFPIHGNRWIAALLLCGLFTAVQTRGDDKEKEKDAEKSITRKFFAVKVNPSSNHWLGVHAVPIDEALKAQLGLKDRLIVNHVMPGSPAGNAGLQVHDILLKFGDKDVSNLDELVKAVTDNGEKEARLIVLRGGKEVTLNIKPEKRPADKDGEGPQFKIKREEIQELIDKLLKGEWNDKDGTYTWRTVGPGILPHALRMTGKEPKFPEGWSISVSKENDKPAKITAKKDGKSYDTTDDRLDVLPEDIRPFVQRMLGGKTFALHLDTEKGDGPGVRHIEIRKSDSTTLQELKAELDQLKKDVQVLKGK